VADLQICSCRMERKYRIRLNSDFQRVRKEGRSWVHRLVVLCALPNGLHYSRFGFAASKRIGKAVTRNRIRRRMREAVRLRRSTITEGWDLVFIARSPIIRATYVDIERAIHDLLTQAHLCKD
jgi:ribonuclease P protein component